MAKFGKWIGAGLGFAMGGPIGALLGLFIGSAFDASSSAPAGTPGNAPGNQRAGRGDFLCSLVVLATALMKADERVMRSELNYVKDFFRRNFGPEGEREALAMIKELLHKDIAVEQVCYQIRFNMPPDARVQLLYFLFGIAKADGRVCEQEIRLLDRIAPLLGIDDTHYRSVKAMFYDDMNAAYQVLGITPEATNEEIKKAYRRMAIENHPDKVGYMGEDIRKAAEEKFTKINQSYEQIKKQRGFN